MLFVVLLLQLDNPLHLWQLWDPEVRLQRRCLARNNALMGQKVQALRTNPPAPHTIAGGLACYVSVGRLATSLVVSLRQHRFHNIPTQCAWIILYGFFAQVQKL